MEDLILELLNDAIWAPNHGLREPWRFVVFQGEGKKKFADAVIHESFSREQRER
ncbi:nitroreductase family protein [Anaerobacillus sp. MEB173]|uniref:nitroreductase family protein n=1 Tax=Anaerobacillus sp. MEB173 TaxID=3383345 RepID=UPI003F928FB3